MTLARLTGCYLCRRWNQPTEHIPGCPPSDMRCIDRAACNLYRYGHPQFLTGPAGKP